MVISRFFVGGGLFLGLVDHSVSNQEGTKIQRFKYYVIKYYVINFF